MDSEFQPDEHASKIIKAGNRKVVEGRIGEKRKGKLPNSKDEKIARSLANPANFGEVVLGFRFAPKQRRALEMCERPGNICIACCNSGGKTSRIIPTLVLWHQWLWPAGKCKVTSGAYLQIEDQVWPAILRHKDKFPKWHWLETPYFESKDPATGETGFFRGFTTNHPGRAEGDHEEPPNSPLMFIVDEAKTAQEWLKKVLMGRVRATRTILMSSHGFAEGWFYETMRLAATEKFGIVEA